MKKRLDLLLVEKQLVKSRSQAADLIKRGQVIIDGTTIIKPSTEVSFLAEITITNPIKYVGRGGLKLEHALAYWHIDVTNKTAIDIGSSTGGFVDCLLQHGAKKVIAVDVGTDQLAPSLRENQQVELHEKTDIRNFQSSEKVDLAVIDVSFISITKLFNDIKKNLLSNGTLIALIKPQFEVGKDYINKQGLVKNDEIRTIAVNAVYTSAKEHGFVVHEIIDSPISGGSGNKEFLLYATLAPQIH